MKLLSATQETTLTYQSRVPSMKKTKTKDKRKSTTQLLESGNNNILFSM